MKKDPVGGRQIFCHSKIDGPIDFIRRLDEQVKERELVFEGLTIRSLPGVFSPEESNSGRFLLKHLGVPDCGLRVIDMGCGTGILGLVALSRGAQKCTFVDVNPRAVENAQVNAEINHLSSRAEFRVSNGFDNVEGEFDLMLLNPPFWDRSASSMTERAFYDEGHAFMAETLTNSMQFLRRGSKLLMVTSNRTSTQRTLQFLNEGGWILDDLILEILPPRNNDFYVRMLWIAARH